jgi:hypothetical protein
MNQSEVKDPESHPYVTISEFHKLTEEIQFKYSQKLKEIKKSKSLGGLTPLPPRSIITTQSDPYGIVEKIWRVLDPNEVFVTPPPSHSSEVTLDWLLIPVLVDVAVCSVGGIPSCAIICLDLLANLTLSWWQCDQHLGILLSYSCLLRAF